MLSVRFAMAPPGKALAGALVCKGLFNTLFEGLCLILLKTKLCTSEGGSCKISSGAYCSIFSTLAYFLVGCVASKLVADAMKKDEDNAAPARAEDQA